MFYDRGAPRQGFGVIVSIPGTDLLSESPKINLPPPPGTRPEREKTCWQCGESFVTSLDVCPNDGARLVDIALDENHDPLIGTTIDARYRVKSRLGEGGMGMVYQAWDPQRREDVAIKVLKADYLRDENIRRRFMHEARIIANLEHPNAVRMHNFGQMPDGNFYMVMEHLKGESLAERLAYKFLTYGEIFNLIPPICDVLAEAHEKGVVHRDLKPENIFIVTDEQGREHSKLIDFGVSKNLARQTLTQTGTLWGTPAYMSPEQARGDAVGAGADIYAMAIILFELICGHLPFTAETQMGYAVKHMHSEPRSMLSIPGMYSPPEELDALILQGLAKQPEERPASMEIFANRLRQIIEESFDDAAAVGIPAQEIDPQGLQEWVAQDAISGPYDAAPVAATLEPTNEISPFRTKQNNAYDTVAVGDIPQPEDVPPVVERPALGRTVAAGIGILLLLSAVVGVAINASQPGAANADERVAASQRSKSSDAGASTGEVSERPSDVSVNSLAGSDAGGDAVGQGASRAAAMVINARVMTQVLSGKSETEAKASVRSRPRKSWRSRNSGRRNAASEAEKREEEKSDKLEDAIKGTF